MHTDYQLVFKSDRQVGILWTLQYFLYYAIGKSLAYDVSFRKYREYP